MIVDDTYCMQGVADGIKKDFAQYDAAVDIFEPRRKDAAANALRHGTYELLFIEPFVFGIDEIEYVRDIIDAARSSGASVCVFTTLFEGRTDQYFGLAKGTDYAEYLQKPASAAEVANVVANTFHLPLPHVWLETEEPGKA